MSPPLTRSYWSHSPTFLGWIWKDRWAGHQNWGHPQNWHGPLMCVRPQEDTGSGAKAAKGKFPVVCPGALSSVSFLWLFITALVRGSVWVTFKELGQQLGSDYEFVDKSTRLRKDLTRFDGRLAVKKKKKQLHRCGGAEP